MISVVLASVVLAPAAAAKPSPYIRAEILASTMEPRPGSTMVVGFKMTPRPGWHGYWSNPGENGLAPTVSWTAPAGLSFGPLLHPAPTLLQSMGLSSFVHSGSHVLLSRVTVSKSVTAGATLPLKASLSWAACSESQCVPQQETLTLQLVAGDGTASADAAVLSRALKAIPREAPSGRYLVSGAALMLKPPQGLRMRPAKARFFPDENGYLAVGKSSVVRPFTIAAPLVGPLPARISGVLTDGSSAYRLNFQPEVAARPAVREKGAKMPAAKEPTAASTPVRAGPAETDETPAPRRQAFLIRLLAIAGLLGLAFIAFRLASRRRR